MKKVSIFGATGSIGTNACRIILDNFSKYKVEVLSANKNYKKLAALSKKLNSKYAVISDSRYYKSLKNELSGSNVKCFSGEDDLANLAEVNTDFTIAAIVGIAGLKPTFKSIDKTKVLALANKEALVCSGNIFMKKAKKHNTQILPLDSEHNALFQIIEKNNSNLIENIVLTASGGPFWNKNINLNKVSVKDALKHPNWKMGKKISIDSATMMNKVLEKIEASILFNLDLSKIDIIIHPKSIVHGIVNYVDGNSIMLASQPDMKIPINYALNWPKRTQFNIKNICLKKIKDLSFFNTNFKTFPSLKLFKYLNNSKLKYSRLISLNASNEVAVDSFLNKKIRFVDIVKVIEKTLINSIDSNPKSISDVFEIHNEACKISYDYINTLRD